MEYENFKERFVEDLKDKLYEKGIEADVTVKYNVDLFLKSEEQKQQDEKQKKTEHTR